ncbi:DNA polymerase, T7 like [Escherichia phage rV5_ev158]|uniref:DNA polymerase family A n=7 Tax=Vequintavirus TaxID=1914852 RepID=A0A0M7QFJ3_9CAUD|nr:DNA polymerase [Escherichia coli]YP_009177440.1 DNA polymerase [Escherichia phage slur16]QHR68693.1 DNA polymerase [Escherichia phage inoa]QHR75764.1 DNA polymerase [Escherichia phage nom]QNR53008.1 DNA-directed DNA polymerase [Escherichia phage vb_EcoM_bov11CS3]QNR53144.1 DNA-directed DNA polymerase [Escherichia phage vb_EcoM_bov22_2]QNR53438.1 DNA-directed DNA polymerase [Escherichia phage vb_EcoM_bov25_3]QOC57228.1 DNA-directed DNA polymerase [Escherichia phage vb_EcoM_bov10K2]CUL0322
MSMWSFDFESSGLLEDPDLYYHCGLFKELNKNRFMLFLPLNDRTHYSEEDIEKAKNFILAKKTLYKDFEVRIADFSELEGWLTGNSDWSPTALNCHNCYSYDFMLMERLSGIHFDMFRDPKCMGTINDHQVNLFDTLAMSRILWPDRPLPKGCPDAVFNPVTKKMQPVGPHGLMAWGYALGNQKVQIDDWRDLPLWKYVDRVFEDVIIQELLWKELVAESKGVFYGKSDMQNFMYDPAKEKPKGFKKITWKNALRRGMLQHFLMELQARQGVYFDIDGAIALRDRCDAWMKEIADRVEPQLPLKELSMSQRPKFPEKPFNQDGTISNNGWKWLKDKLGYPVDMSALEFKAPPKRAFTSTGDVSKMGIKWCEEMGCKDPDKMADFLRGYIKGTSTPQPLPKELMDQAISDLQQKRMPDCKIPMKISNQDDIKRYLISAGWLPTMWRTKDVTKDSKKKALPDADVDARVYAYMDELLESEYCDLIINFWNKTDAKFQTTVHKFRSFPNSERIKKEVFGKIRRKARALITSPQLKDTFGHLCPNLEKLNGEMAKDIVLWLSLRNRRSVLDPIKEDKVDTGLLNHPRLKIDHKLPAKSSGLTNTSRQKHSICANMPKPSPKVVMGKEMRSLWGVPPGYFEIGIDGSNLEQLIGAWGAFEFDNGLYYDVVSNGDAHQNNAEAYTKVAGREVSRNDGKPITYGVMYGAQKDKVADMLDISPELGQRVIDALWDANPGLKGRKEDLEKFWEATGKKFIYSFDGHAIWTRSKHSLLNAYQQNGGASLCDLVGILMHHQMVKRGWYDEGVRRIIYYHDEYQLQVPDTPKYKTVYTFDTIEELEAFKAEQEAKLHVFDGHKYKKARKDEDGNEVVDRDGNTVYDPILNDDGKLELIWSPVGEMVVHCFWQASKMMGVPFQITGEYLCGRNWGDCH